MLWAKILSRIEAKEARRRITFFVNSLLIEQPAKKRVKRVVKMPSLTTLTPYYKEDVVSSMTARSLSWW